MSLRVTVLGFSGAAPLLGACPAYLVSDGQTTVLLDCGPGTLERLWRMELLGELDAIVISHMHVDHVLDLIVLSGEITRVLAGWGRPRLYVPSGGGEVLAALDGSFSAAPVERTRFEETFEVAEYAPEDRLEIGALRLRFAPTAHRGLCCAVRVTDGRAAVVYGADGAPSSELERLAAGADLLILEATYAQDANAASEQRHMTAGQAGELAAAAGAARLVLTHLLPGERERALDPARQAFGGPVELAAEGLTYELPS